MITNYTLILQFASKCLKGQYYQREGERFGSCAIGCRNVTMCGESIVPDDHLYVIRDFSIKKGIMFTAMSILSIGE